MKKLSLSLIECIEIALEIEIGAISKSYCLDPGCFLHAYFYPKGYETPEHGQRIGWNKNNLFLLNLEGWHLLSVIITSNHFNPIV